ncbi:acyl carrier protein [Actinomadura madurae]|uniref:acyl carrier protein n=1 Tax=Actinomadura madurae TaxID=1993 RepID=UPI0020273DBE|nr:acyl carrier protein [Actinomadura madurae]MCP9955739.1 acyl carrier protein [Actinomadura madurae]MCP9972471.1 acyl carrier protein [Actinomadura madurae]MCP9984983.1 acyl carrier protein [Actinomadura madurae]MCQ0003458.1 acyl carrier protein [Actinomadura madurae]MCQ0021183.1 acyl carrier protein [Actinomadura madurae]
MTTEQNAESIEQELLAFLEERIGDPVSPTQELFASGLASSMFAMELVVHLEKTYGIAIVGSDLKLDNFRTVRIMTELVGRLRATSAVVGGD